MIFVHYRRGVNAASEIDRLRTSTRPLSSFAGLDVLDVQRPAEIVNATAIGSAPILLGSSLMIASMVSLTLALGASARQRRRELAILRTLGFSSGQLVGSLLWQASGLVAVGLLVGIPLGRRRCGKEPVGHLRRADVGGVEARHTGALDHCADHLCTAGRQRRGHLVRIRGATVETR